MHAGIFGLASVIALGKYVNQRPIWIAVVSLTVFHGIVDYSKCTVTRKMGKEKLWLFLLDQLIHVLSIAVVAYIFRLRAVEPTPGYGPVSFAVIAVWALPIVVVLAGSDLCKSKFDSITAMAASRSKLGMIERAGLFMAFFAMGWFWFGAVVIIPRIVGWIRGKKIGITPVMWLLSIGLGLLAKLMI